MEFFDQIADLRSVYFEGSIYLYLDDAEKRVREKAIALNRGRLKYPWGMALLQALRNTSNAWQLAEKHLKERPPKGKGRGRQHLTDWPEPPQGNYFQPPLLNWAPPPPRGPKGGYKGGSKDKGGKQKHQKPFFKTISESSNGQICKAYNDQRNCSNATCQYQHVCDVLLASGRACAKQHRRSEHNDQTHGPSQRR